MYVDPVLKEAATNAAMSNAAGTNATLPSGAEGEQEMKDNGELVQNAGSQ